MNPRPYPRALVETCGLCVCTATVCLRLVAELEKADFYSRVSMELIAGMPELLEVRRLGRQ